MILKIFVIRDVKANYLNPIFERNKEFAIRNLENAMRNKDTLLYSHAQDFDLWEIGSFDNETGLIVPTETPNLVVSLASIKQRGEE